MNNIPHCPVSPLQPGQRPSQSLSRCSCVFISMVHTSGSAGGWRTQSRSAANWRQIQTSLEPVQLLGFLVLLQP